MKKYLVAGLLVWMPLAITLWVLTWLLGTIDGVFAWILSATQAVLPATMHAGVEKLRHVPGLSVLAMAALLITTGMFVANMFGQWWLRQGDRLMGKIPIVKSIYSSVKQVSDTLFSSSGNAFREAVLVQYPRQGSWTIAFVTGKPSGEVAEQDIPVNRNVSAQLLNRVVSGNIDLGERYSEVLGVTFDQLAAEIPFGREMIVQACLGNTQRLCDVGITETIKAARLHQSLGDI